VLIGSAQAGPKIAAILSVVESCRRLKLPVRDYLAAVLPGLADLPIQRLPNLIPAAGPPSTLGIVSRRLVVRWKRLPILRELFASPRHYQ
jgi:hypothetical protein